MKALKLITFITSLSLMGLAARAETVVVVSAKSPVGNLTPEQVTQLFLGKVSDFPGGGPAFLVDQSDGPTRDEFYSKFLKRDNAQIRAYWAKVQFTGKGLPPKEVGASAEAKKIIAANPNSIGYVDKSAVDSSLKIVATAN